VSIILMAKSLGSISSAFAAIFLILAVLALGFPEPPAGLLVAVAKPIPCRGGDSFLVILSAQGHGRVAINADSVPLSLLGTRLDAIFKTRVERIAYVNGNDASSFNEVTQVIDVAAKHLDYIALLTSSVLWSKMCFSVPLSRDRLLAHAPLVMPIPELPQPTHIVAEDIPVAPR
jgi:hypothetical protein